MVVEWQQLNGALLRVRCLLSTSQAGSGRREWFGLFSTVSMCLHVVHALCDRFETSFLKASAACLCLYGCCLPRVTR